MRLKRVLTLLILGGVAVAGVWGLGIQTPPGPRTARDFDPDRLADLETAMWQSYYRQENAALFSDLVIALREQFRYPWAKAALGSASATSVTMAAVVNLTASSLRWCGGHLPRTPRAREPNRWQRARSRYPR